MLFTSATAHLLNQKSHYIHLNCFMFDYAGISFYAYGSSTILIYSCSPIWFYSLIDSYVFPLIGLHCGVSFFLAAFSLTIYTQRPFPFIKRFIQMTPLAILWSISMFVILVLPFFSKDVELSLKINYFNHAVHAVAFLLGVAFFSTEFPQRIFPGKLDFFGQSHHWFHICVFLTAKLQFDSCYTDYIENRHLIEVSRQAPSLLMCLLPLILLSVFCLLVIGGFRQIMWLRHRFDENGNIDDRLKIK